MPFSTAPFCGGAAAAGTHRLRRYSAWPPPRTTPGRGAVAVISSAMPVLCDTKLCGVEIAMGVVVGVAPRWAACPKPLPVVVSLSQEDPCRSPCRSPSASPGDLNVYQADMSYETALRCVGELGASLRSGHKISISQRPSRSSARSNTERCCTRLGLGAISLRQLVEINF